MNFFSIWFVVLLVNQIFLFGGCIKSYCLVAGLPHTGIIAFFIYKFLKNDKKEVKIQPQKEQEKPQNKTTKTEEKKDPLKEKGDNYERFIGRKFEEKGELVIYNGFIRGYKDKGVDIISI